MNEHTGLPGAAVLMMVALLAGFSACSKDTNPAGPGNSPTDKELIARGWQQFEAQRYDSAATTFTNALNVTSSNASKAEAMCGRGWASMYLRDLLKARMDFSNAMVIPGIVPAIMNDARVGNAFALFSLNAFSDAAVSATSALTDNASYTFAHDAKVTTKRVRLLLAQSYYAYGQFPLAAAQLDIIDAPSAPHAPDPVLLLAAISALLNTL